jgi:thioredoxin-dependent peroxiredoxin
MLKIGQKAPDFILPSSKGKTLSLNDFDGRKIVLYFYPKDNTSGCTKEACSFESNLQAIKKKGACIIGVSTDSVESHVKFTQKYGLNFPLLSDEKKKMAKSYGVWKEKSMYGRKYFGIERTTIVIDEKGIVQKIFNKVKVNGHTDEVIAVL